MEKLHSLFWLGPLLAVFVCEHTFAANFTFGLYLFTFFSLFFPFLALSEWNFFSALRRGVSCNLMPVEKCHAFNYNKNDSFVIRVFLV